MPIYGLEIFSSWTVIYFYCDELFMHIDTHTQTPPHTHHVTYQFILRTVIFKYFPTLELLCSFLYVFSGRVISKTLSVFFFP